MKLYLLYILRILPLIVILVKTINIDDNLPISYTGNQAKYFKICVGATVTLTINVDIGDQLINGSIGTVMYMNNVATNEVAKGIYVKFDDVNAGNSYEDNRLCGIFKQCVSISANAKRFSFKRDKSLIVAERKRFLLILAHALTIHKSQGRTILQLIT